MTVLVLTLLIIFSIEALWQARRDNMIDIKSDDAIVAAYRKALARHA
ncbi:Glutamate synthase [NADPH] large chain (EC [uncultured Gammaproteobacteria bacterium]|nr:Glutamate synthase [NADPH] large chain (EC [uncultured Gammaproteobacteria bacterium]